MTESGEMLLCGHCMGFIDDGERVFALTQRGHRYHEACYREINAAEIEQDAKTDRWHVGYFAKTRPTDPDELEGWLHRRNESPPVAMPARPEGYYHMPLGTFD